MDNNNTNRLSNNNILIDGVDGNFIVSASASGQNGNIEISEPLVISTLEDEDDGDFSDGDLSFREAILIAENGNTISFDSNLSGGTLELSLGELTLDKDLVINGLGANNLIIDANQASRIFNINDGDTESDINVSIDGLTITRGSASSQRFPGDINPGTFGGSIRNDENLTLSNIIVNNNFALADGGGIFSSGTLNISNSTISGNSASRSGGIDHSGEGNITNSTISNNIANPSDLDINTSAGIDNTGNLTITSSIVAGNSNGDLGGEFSSGGNNLIGDLSEATGFFNGDNGDIVGSTDSPIDPKLGELQDNGGATSTEALLEGSPAIDAGSNPNNLETDQRGEGFERTIGNGTDIGAFEVQDTGGEIPNELVVSTLEDENDGNYSDGDLSLREAIALANEREGADTIAFNSSLSGGTIILNLGELAINGSLTILGLGSEQLTIDANEGSRVFNLDNGNAETKIDIAINGLKITGGNASNEELGIFGGGIFNQENLELNDSLVTKNTAVAGGGIYNQDATASINNSAISNNSTSGSASGVVNRGSGIANSNSTVEINNSSINNNTNTGIEVDESEVTIVDSSVSGNSGLGTGGIRSYRSTVNLENSIVSNNSASALGNSGGINSSLDSVLNINNSTITDNSGEAGNPNDPRARTADASGILASGTTNITNSTISNNRGVGFGIKNSGDLNISNSTFSGNAGTGILNQSNGFVDISNSTIANNQGALDAGGIHNENNSVDSVVISSNIIANNSGDADLDGETFTSEGNNLIGNGNGIDNFVNSDLVGTADNPIDPRLGELQDNGGATATLALQENSPAIDAGSNPNNLETDQRGEGFERTIGNGTDIGAYEVQTISNNNDIIGTDRDDVLRGTADDDRIFGLDGADFVKGLNGSDFLSGGNGNDYLKGGKGSDTLEGDTGNDFIKGGGGFDVIRGGDGHDRILGGRGVDTINDGAGNDVLFGGRGNDIFLASNPGYDHFTGGKGNDIYVYGFNSDAGFFDRDRIIDFNQGEDVIAFRPFVSVLAAFDEFVDLDTNGSGILDAHDERVKILGHSTVIDFSDLFGRHPHSDTITLVGATHLDESNFRFNETVVGTEFI